MNQEEITINEAVEAVIKIGVRFEQQSELAEATARADRDRKRKLLEQAQDCGNQSRP